jgi:HlyD family secretion protein
MTANVKILVNSLEGVLKVPNAALRYRSTAEKKRVWILDKPNKPRPVSVTTGETDGTSTQIRQGDLKTGDRVIVASSEKESASNNVSRNAAGRGPGF